jgi:hypothetical protein
LFTAATLPSFAIASAEDPESGEGSHQPGAEPTRPTGDAPRGQGGRQAAWCRSRVQRSSQHSSPSPRGISPTSSHAAASTPPTPLAARRTLISLFSDCPHNKTLCRSRMRLAIHWVSLAGWAAISWPDGVDACAQETIVGSATLDLISNKAPQRRNAS